MEDEIEMRKETVRISGDRNLYIYTFEIDGEVLPPVAREDKMPEINQA